MHLMSEAAIVISYVVVAFTGGSMPLAVRLVTPLAVAALFMYWAAEEWGVTISPGVFLQIISLKSLLISCKLGIVILSCISFLRYMLDTVASGTLREGLTKSWNITNRLPRNHHSWFHGISYKYVAGSELDTVASGTLREGLIKSWNITNRLPLIIMYCSDVFLIRAFLLLRK